MSEVAAPTTTGSDPLEDREVAWRVVGGGVPTAAQLAAVTIALTPVAVVPVDDDMTDDQPTRTSNWARAAIIEGIGGRPPTSWQDLVQGRFGLGHVGDPLTNG